MNFNIKGLIKILISVALAAGLVFMLLKTISVEKLVSELKNCDYTWVLVSIVISLLSHFVRALRWNMLLATNQFYPNAFRTFQAIMVGYIANLAIPRIGEVTRCGILNKTDQIPVGTSLGTVVVERLFDVIMLFSLTGLCLLLEFDMLIGFFKSFFWQ